MHKLRTSLINIILSYMATFNTVSFLHRYTVVFSVREYVENEKKYFEQCLVSSLSSYLASLYL